MQHAVANCAAVPSARAAQKSRRGIGCEPKTARGRKLRARSRTMAALESDDIDVAVFRFTLVTVPSHIAIFLLNTFILSRVLHFYWVEVTPALFLVALRAFLALMML